MSRWWVPNINRLWHWRPDRVQEVERIGGPRVGCLTVNKIAWLRVTYYIDDDWIERPPPRVEYRNSSSSCSNTTEANGVLRTPPKYIDGCSHWDTERWQYQTYPAQFIGIAYRLSLHLAVSYYFEEFYRKLGDVERYLLTSCMARHH